MNTTYQRVLTIAGSDSGGGAGIQADLKAIAACGCYGSSAITAITAQNTEGVFDVHPVPTSMVRRQIEVVLQDIGADAIKIGMLHARPVIQAVADQLSALSAKNIVLDPVMVATSGDPLLQRDAVGTLKEDLFPIARVITPNIPEASLLLGRNISHQDMLKDAAKQLSQMGHVSVLLKAGHLNQDRLLDIFYNAESDQILELPAERIETPNTHGTGCTLSSALAAFLAKGMDLNEAVKAARSYTYEAIVAGAAYKIGRGHGPVHHFHTFW